MARQWRNTYGDSDLGQLHFAVSGDVSSGTALVCLHPVPYSGLYFTTFAEHLPESVPVILADLPGYGRSAQLTGPTTIEAMAAALVDALAGIGQIGPVDLLGFHTGTLVAAEMAHHHPDHVRRLVFAGVPYFSEAIRVEKRPQVSQPNVITEDLASLQGRWDFAVARRAEGISLKRAMELFAVTLVPGEDDWFGFDAAFAYAPEAAFAGITQPATFIISPGGLEQPTRDAQAATPGSAAVELMHLGPGAFDVAAADLADATAHALST